MQKTSQDKRIPDLVDAREKTLMWGKPSDQFLSLLYQMFNRKRVQKVKVD